MALDTSTVNPQWLAPDLEEKAKALQKAAVDTRLGASQVGQDLFVVASAFLIFRQIYRDRTGL
jgi:hypothetical protein